MSYIVGQQSLASIICRGKYRLKIVFWVQQSVLYKTLSIKFIVRYIIYKPMYVRTAAGLMQEFVRVRPFTVGYWASLLS
jgi:hypothetical protein